ncbi:MAG: arginine deiminase-related protein [Weeksellaceae bacterium]|nr:arginine deiminase-related protein [Weeksellaceae bacterium]
MAQYTDTILMVQPVSFYYNEETAVNNYFQKEPERDEDVIQKLALQEFNSFVEKLRNHGVEVIVVKDNHKENTPDSVFPNNWFSTHEDGAVILYPMFAENRRKERRPDLQEILQNNGFIVDRIVDLSASEDSDKFLEGTGSMILDHDNQILYAAISPRTDKDLVLQWCEKMDFTPLMFRAVQSVEDQRIPIYHTNVMLTVGDKYAVVCLETIDDEQQRAQVIESLNKTEKEIIAITEEQMHKFAGNMLQVANKQGEKFLVMSQQAYNSLTEEQIENLEKHNNLITVAIPTIEKLGGGSARCMMAEVFLPVS